MNAIKILNLLKMKAAPDAIVTARFSDGSVCELGEEARIEDSSIEFYPKKPNESNITVKGFISEVKTAGSDECFSNSDTEFEDICSSLFDEPIFVTIYNKIGELECHYINGISINVATNTVELSCLPAGTPEPEPAFDNVVIPATAADIYFIKKALNDNAAEFGIAIVTNKEALSIIEKLPNVNFKTIPLVDDESDIK